MSNDFLKQAQELQRRMEKIQEELGSQEITGYAGGGIIEFTLSGKLDPISLNISKEALRDRLPEDVLDQLDLTELEDLLLVAFKDAKDRVEKHVQNQMSSITGGLDLGALGD